MATLGSVISSPEASWIRFKTNTSRIVTTGTWNYDTKLYTSSVDGSLSFKFKGTKLRLLGYCMTGYAGKIELIIDGVISYVNMGINNLGSNVLVYENISLSNEVHTVSMRNADYSIGNGLWQIEGIDLDSATGNLLHPLLNQVYDAENAQIGDCIACKYSVSTSNTAGTFAELGYYIGNDISITAPGATPTGLFFLIKIAKGLWLADRVIQHNITWDILNSNKLIEGVVIKTIVPLDITSQSYIIDGGTYAGRTFAFNNVIGSYIGASWQAATSNHLGWVGQLFPSAKNIKGYSMSASSDAVANTPTEWTFEASNDGVNWTVLDSNTSVVWIASETKYFNITNENYYTRYRINVTNSGGSGYAVISEIEMFETKINMNIKVRSMSGGNAFVDSYKNKSTTDYSLGAWPTNNEWDKYIVNSDLSGTITKGNKNIWNFGYVGSWCKETPILAAGASTNRINRGKDSASNIVISISSTNSTTVGFRPMFEIKESLSKAANLFY